ncbi:MAG: UvrB/UvrC motif-containing protein [Planctomycetaceae bacterium]|jgi:protein arginine kinase activator|nr:UvrB/UvrC motif-containing protein [Planctomycetaceae bacterium]
MKCQKCEKAATFHITELTGPKPLEHHLCEEHAREYLNNSAEQHDTASSLTTTLSQGMAKQMSANKVAAELKELDQQTCPVCGISFYDFRSRGRLGCPNDYDCFSKQMDALIINIHGVQEHIGKTPKHIEHQSNHRTLLIKLRRDLNEAVRLEEYERASQLRDQIKEIETE